VTGKRDEELDRFVKDKAEIRKVLSGKLVELQKEWEKLSTGRMDEKDNALVSVLADLTAEVSVGTHDIAEAQFLDLLRTSYEMARAKRDAIESGAFV